MQKIMYINHKILTLKNSLAVKSKSLKNGGHFENLRWHRAIMFFLYFYSIDLYAKYDVLWQFASLRPKEVLISPYLSMFWL